MNGSRRRVTTLPDAVGPERQGYKRQRTPILTWAKVKMGVRCDDAIASPERHAMGKGRADGQPDRQPEGPEQDQQRDREDQAAGCCRAYAPCGFPGLPAATHLLYPVIASCRSDRLTLGIGWLNTKAANAAWMLKCPVGHTTTRFVSSSGPPMESGCRW